MELPRDSCIVLFVIFELSVVSIMSGLSYKTATHVHMCLSLSMMLVFASKPDRFLYMFIVRNAFLLLYLIYSSTKMLMSVLLSLIYLMHVHCPKRNFVDVSSWAAFF